MPAVEGGQGSVAVSADGAFSSGSGDNKFGGFSDIFSGGAFSPSFSGDGSSNSRGVSPYLIGGVVLAVVIVMVWRR